ncbi:MAG TPA: HlyD family efflux transporter periplasmic adaptor subunit [Hellea balneolensis]|uniref:HlyD family efflux transporter periplasmic adaptor subunit n=1 Tax=Hellea balneolensis TaxID=287478 RepID=A0A7C5M1W0_9PROT|nr:HlyD family efflux transporter periplasmic adaptor subunit [Hellea balneolensis]
MAKSEPKIVVDNQKLDKSEPQGPGLLETLLAFEGEVLGAPDRLHLKHIAVNRGKTLIPSAQFFLMTNSGNKFSLQAITHQSTINAQSPFLQWLVRYLRETAVQKLRTGEGFSKTTLLTLETRRASDDFEYSLPYACWAPFGQIANPSGLLITKDAPWSEAEQALAERLGLIVGAKWYALGRKRKKPRALRKKALVAGTALALALVLCIPIPATTMAPAEVIAKSPFIVSAPMDGVIDEMLVKPGTLVKQGDALARLNDIVYRNEYTLASEENAVAGARLQQTSLSAFVDSQAKREIAVTRAEQKLARARQDYAKDQLSKTILIAKRDGLVIYSDEKDWTGRPVAIGEKIMEIADPARVLLRLESPIADSVTLRRGARVRMFLDSDPLAPISAKLTRSDYYAKPTPNGTLAYEAYAELETTQSLPRIGARGVAKIYGDKAPLGLWLARRPIVSLRQRFGF